jgi:hypothetical protein
MGQHLLHLIVREPLPFHAPNISNGWDRNGSKKTVPENSRMVAILSVVGLR